MSRESQHFPLPFVKLSEAGDPANVQGPHFREIRSLHETEMKHRYFSVRQRKPRDRVAG
jgi:hypothetical protein